MWVSVWVSVWLYVGLDLGDEVLLGVYTLYLEVKGIYSMGLLWFMTR